SGRRRKRFAQQSVDKGGRRTDHSLRDERAVAITVQHAELCLADAKCILQHGAEDRLKVAGRARNDAQHFGGRRLLLQRLGKFARTRLKLLLQLARVRLELVFRCRLRVLGRVKMTHAGRPELRIRRSEHSTPGPLLCETVHSAGPSQSTVGNLQGLARPRPSRVPAPFTTATRRNGRSLPAQFRNISGVAQGPAVRSVIPWVRDAGDWLPRHSLT